MKTCSLCKILFMRLDRLLDSILSGAREAPRLDLLKTGPASKKYFCGDFIAF
jgi:hypothetical protein